MEQSNLVQFSDRFSSPLCVATSTYAYQILVYMQRCPDLEMANIGSIVLPFLRDVRHVKPEFLRLYYESLSGVIRALLRYAQLEESCSKSGAYNADRLKVLDGVRRIITQFEYPEDPRTLDYLRNLLHS